MEKLTQSDSEVYEGTWEELSQLADRFNGHKLRVTVLPEAKTENPLILRPPGLYAEYLREKLANAPDPTPEEIVAEEQEIKELIRNMNENRRRDGAEPVFPDE